VCFCPLPYGYIKWIVITKSNLPEFAWIKTHTLLPGLCDSRSTPFYDTSPGYQRPPVASSTLAWDAGIFIGILC